MVDFKTFKVALGRCPRCFRESFFAMIAFAGIAIALHVIRPDSMIWMLVVPAAVGAALLWLLHMTLFSARVSEKAVARHGDDPVMGRRVAMRAFVQGAGIGIALSVLSPTLVMAGEGCLEDALCDATHPCSGCKCNYPPNATTGYCR